MIAKRPDSYLKELQNTIRDAYGKTVDLATVYRTLKRCGYTLKQESITAFCLFCIYS